ncbi:YbhB/YbcL family Raf kinase inhibitor-like protein [soil metagenome]
MPTKRNLLETVAAPLGFALKARRAGAAHSVQTAPELQSTHHIAVTSTAFENGGEIPDKYTGIGSNENLSPALTWSDLPPHTAQIMLIIEDTDVPGDRPAIHLAALVSPAVAHLSDGEIVESNPHLRLIPDLRGRPEYIGPRPFPGHGRHHYGFYVFALDRAIAVDAKVGDVDELRLAVTGHVIGAGSMMGWKEG